MGEKRAKVSIVVPVYRVERYLPKCLESVRAQSFRDWEMILVDDGSPDGCGAICDACAEGDGRVRVIHKRNGGLSAARNDGMDAATGEWALFLDSDDWCEPDYLERLLEVPGGEAADIVCAGGHIRESEAGSERVRLADAPFRFEGEREVRRLAARVLARAYPVPGLAQGPCFCAPWDKLYRLSFLRRNGLRFDAECRMGEDTLFNLRAFAHANRVAGGDCIGYHYRSVESSITRGFNPDKPAQCLDWLGRLEGIRRALFAGDEDLRQAADVAAVGVALSALKCCLLHPANPQSGREAAWALREMKRDPLLRRAIRSGDDRYFTPGCRALKHLLRQPWLWPLRAALALNARAKRARGGAGEP